MVVVMVMVMVVIVVVQFIILHISILFLLKEDGLSLLYRRVTVFLFK